MFVGSKKTSKYMCKYHAPTCYYSYKPTQLTMGPHPVWTENNYVVFFDLYNYYDCLWM